MGNIGGEKKRREGKGGKAEVWRSRLVIRRKSDSAFTGVKSNT